MNVVGYSNRTRYWQNYVFSHPPEGYIYTRSIDALPSSFLKKIGLNKEWLRYTKFFLPLKRIDIFHLYNQIIVNKKPWIVEVETLIPRYGKPPKDSSSRSYQFGINKLKSRFCKKIIFTSEYTRGMNEERLTRYGVDPEKFTVVYRAVERYRPLNDQADTFNILFVGNAFYRKGGPELLEAFARIGRGDMRLTIVSTFGVDWEIFPTEEEKRRVQQIISQDHRIRVLTKLPHTKVVDEMRKAHVYVNTTFADPFNNSLMEAIACQLPVITSDIRAIPEFVYHGKNGFIVSADKHQRKKMTDEIEVYLLRLMDDEPLRQVMGVASLGIAKDKFDIDVRNSKLKKIYDEALA